MRVLLLLVPRSCMLFLLPPLELLSTVFFLIFLLSILYLFLVRAKFTIFILEHIYLHLLSILLFSIILSTQWFIISFFHTIVNILILIAYSTLLAVIFCYKHLFPASLFSLKYFLHYPSYYLLFLLSKT